MIIPVGDQTKQKMVRVSKKNGKLIKEEFDHFAFVPLLGEHGWK
jgi:protein-L-isoaspartate(D-aspartate) O-methyltransferase